MITFSGVSVTPEGTNAPPLYDMAFGLAGIRRFAGQTPEPWTVLQHLWACAVYADLRGWTAETVFHCAIHDIGESVSGDIPNGWKTEDMKALLHELDKRIWRSLGVPEPSPLTEVCVKKADHAILVAEADFVGTAPQRDGIRKWLGSPPVDPDARDAVSVAAEVLNSSQHVNAALFEDLVLLLRRKAWPLR